jgi:hypothetical protein
MTRALPLLALVALVACDAPRVPPEEPEREERVLLDEVTPLTGLDAIEPVARTEPEPEEPVPEDPEPADPAGPATNPPGSPDAFVEEIDHAFLIAHFGGDPVDAHLYADDMGGFQAYLDDVGVQFFSASEIASPYNAQAAADCGLSVLLPEQELWERAAALAVFSDQLRALVDEPVFMRNWWRPPCYNAAVGGAAGGDHPDGDAVDLDFNSSSSRALAQSFLCEDYWSADLVDEDDIAPGADVDPRLNMSVGLGAETIHLGVLSRNGRRYWTYSSYSPSAAAGDCW